MNFGRMACRFPRLPQTMSKCSMAPALPLQSDQAGMSIDFSRVRALTAGEIIRALLADGFLMRKHRGGSLQRYQHSDGRRVTVPFHGSNTTFLPKTLRSIIEEQARWTGDDLVRLKLVRK